MLPEDARYTAEHEWVREADDGAFRVGITDFAQDSLGDIVYISLPGPGTQVSAGASLGEVESTKSVSEIYAPFSGEVVAANADLQAKPELVNSDPYGEGWMVTIRPSNPAELESLLSPSDYQQRLG